jgi:hypothetical protein
MRVGAILAMVMLLGACGSSGGGNSQATPTPTPSPSPLACTASGAASASWPGPDSRTSTTPPIVSAVVAGDILTLAFDSGTPAFEVQPQSSSHFFVGDGRGQWVDVPGSAGAVIILKGFRGDMQNYAGPASLKSQGPLLLEVREVSEFEGNLHWAAGLSKSGCANVTAAGSNLTFHFIALPA